MTIHPKLKEWFHRYAPAEVCGTIGAQVFSFLWLYFTGSRTIAAMTWAIWDSGSIYTFMVSREILWDSRKWKKYGVLWIIITLRNIVAEFGIAEAVDLFLVRPMCMYFFPLLLNNFSIWIFLWGVFANIIFYSMAIGAYELRKKILK